jgi:hypothetical protein
MQRIRNEWRRFGRVIVGVVCGIAQLIRRLLVRKREAEVAPEIAPEDEEAEPGVADSDLEPQG